MATTGFENSKTEDLVVAVENIRAGFERLINMSHDDIFKARGEKSAAPAASFHTSRSLLENAEAECFKRGMDPLKIAGRDWTALFIEIENEGC